MARENRLTQVATSTSVIIAAQLTHRWYARTPFHLIPLCAVPALTALRLTGTQSHVSFSDLDASERYKTYNLEGSAIRQLRQRIQAESRDVVKAVATILVVSPSKPAILSWLKSREEELYRMWRADTNAHKSCNTRRA